MSGAPITQKRPLIPLSHRLFGHLPDALRDVGVNTNANSQICNSGSPGQTA